MRLDAGTWPAPLEVVLHEVWLKDTVRDAMFLFYACVVLSDCTAEPIANNPPRSNH